MELMIAEEATDNWTRLDVIDIRKEGQSLVIVTGPASFIVGPLKEFAEKVVDLIDE